MSTESISIAASKSGRAAHSRRQKVWALIWVAIAIAAAYFLIPELAGLQESLQSLNAVQPAWLLTGSALVALRYVLTAVSLRAAVGHGVPFGTTLLVQVASGFVGRLTPEGVGWLVLNQRFLELAGIGRTSALAAISLKVIAGALTRIGIMAIVAFLVGASGGFTPEIPAVWPCLLGGLLVLVAGAFLARVVFPSAAARARASVVSAARDSAAVFRQPARAVALFASSAGLPLSFGLALWTSAIAFGADVSLIDLLAVYLAGTAVAAASPTPGNIGAVEITLSAGLTTVGVPSAAAVAAVLVYRLLTFWLPLVPGFFAFRYLQAQQRI